MPAHRPLQPGYRRTILVVDDRADNRRNACKILSDLGYRCFEADSGQEAIEVLDMIMPGRIALVLIDIVMPKVDGLDLAQHVRERWPWQRILFVSAHPAEFITRANSQLGDLPLLRIPFSPTELVATVERVLGSAPPSPLPDIGSARATSEGQPAE